MEKLAESLAPAATKFFAALVFAAFATGCQKASSVSPSASQEPSGPVRMGQLPREGFFSGATLNVSSIDDVVKGVRPGGVLIVSEQHGNQKHYAHQKLALVALAKTNLCTVSVGLEFLTWNHQKDISDYFNGILGEADFLKNVEWGGNPFADYRDQALFARTAGGTLLGINAPKILTSAISKKGIAGLTAEELALMPPNFELGTPDYRERFDAVMGNHVPPSALDRYFAAQSTWDESMAWQAEEFLRQNPTHCLAIIVGDFHAAWGGGLPQRLRARGVANVTVVSQIETEGMTEEDLSTELGPHPRYGSRADALWLSQTPSATP